jgi:adenylate cyclase
MRPAPVGRSGSHGPASRRSRRPQAPPRYSSGRPHRGDPDLSSSHQPPRRRSLVRLTSNVAKIETRVSTIFNMTWNIRVGQVIPKTNDVALINGAVKLRAVLLYADLFDSTTLARKFPRSVAAKIVRAYLSSMTQMVKDSGGEIRSFDGDRIMAVFVGSSKSTAAAKCALQMNYVVQKILKPQAEAKFPSLQTEGFLLGHCAGIAQSDVFVVRGGVRGSNDLVFIGSAPNVAAKLSDIRNPPWHSYISSAVYRDLNDSTKIGANGKNMWTPVKRAVGDEQWDLYKSNWIWKP